MNSRRIFWGALLVLGGIYFLLKQTGVLFFHSDFLVMRKLWPVFIILIGLRLLLPKTSKAMGIILLVLLVGFFGYSIYEGIRLKQAMSSPGLNGLSFPFGNHPGDGDFGSKSPEEAVPNDEDSSSGSNSVSKSSINQRFSIPLDSKVERVSLTVTGGAAHFISDVTHSFLFEATTNLNNSSPYRLERTNSGKIEEVKLISDKIQNRSNNFDKNSSNEVKIRLNPSVFWDIDLSVGVGKADYDLSGYKIEKLDIHQGLSEINLKLGRLVPKCAMKVESGLASFNLQVPKSSGCILHMEGDLNQKNIPGFDKVGSKTFETSNYVGADRKIEITFSGGVSQISVQQY